MLFYLIEARILERTDEGVFSDAFPQGERIEVADAPP